nr:integrase, catalytic region, zinc finger, CCHC-type, peptidase aspartic, catalytic [Tanacetum cinerariifolium]
MNRDMLTVGSTMRIPLLYRGEYSQWVERFINYLEEQTDGEAMINSIKNGGQPLPRVTQVSITGTTSTEQPPLKDKSMWSDQEERIQKIDRLARSLLIQGLSNDIYSLIDSNKTAKDLWDALARHMLGFEYGDQDKKAINFEDDYFQEIINPDFEKIDSPFQQTSSLKPYFLNVILEKIIIDLEDEVVNLLEKEKVNLETIESLKSKGVESSENVSFKSKNQSENDCYKIEKVCDKEENLKVIAPGMFKLNVSQCVSSISMSKSSCDSKNVEIKLKRKRRKRKSSKQNVKQVDNDVSRANNDVVHFSDLDTFSSVRRPNNSGVIWKKKGPSNTSNVGLSAVSVLNLNKNVKRCSRKDLLACNNSHLGETSSAYVYNDTMNVSCNPKMCDLLDDNNFFIFDDVNVRISPVSKMPFRKKPRDSMQIHSKSNMINLYLELCISGFINCNQCSKHITGNRALSTNFVEKFPKTVRFGNNDFAVIVGYGDVVIGSMTIKKVYYVEGLGHNLFSVGQFCDKGLEVAFRKSTCFVRNKDGVDLLTGDRSSNLYTIALIEVA